ncbi:MAG: hypothetical protein ACO1SV_20245 [Fimbriimonas sp.]
MKRLLPIFLSAGVMLLAGCHLSDEGTLGDGQGHEGPAAAAGGTETHEESGETHAGTPTAEVAGNAGGQTAAAFPASTPPTDRPSVTTPNYWAPRRINTEPSAGGHGGPEAAHGEPTGVGGPSHGAGGGH